MQPRRIAYIVALMSVVAVFGIVTSCERSPEHKTRTEAHALFDSVSVLPHIIRHASARLDSARASLASADSLMEVDRGPLARIYYAESMIHSLLAVIDAEEAQEEEKSRR